MTFEIGVKFLQLILHLILENTKCETKRKHKIECISKNKFLKNKVLFCMFCVQYDHHDYLAIAVITIFVVRVNDN